jgi:hypothetical protein
MEEHPTIIDRDRCAIQVWNSSFNTYCNFSFEFIEDLVIIIKQTKDAPGCIYKHIDP